METLPITARSFEKDYFVDGDNYEKAYKNHLSGFREWSELEHSDEWLVFPENIGVSIDETCLSAGEVCNKEAASLPLLEAKEVIKALENECHVGLL